MLTRDSLLNRVPPFLTSIEDPNVGADGKLVGCTNCGGESLTLLSESLLFTQRRFHVRRSWSLYSKLSEIGGEPTKNCRESFGSEGYWRILMEVYGFFTARREEERGTPCLAFFSVVEFYTTCECRFDTFVFLISSENNRLGSLFIASRLDEDELEKELKKVTSLDLFFCRSCQSSFLLSFPSAPQQVDDPSSKLPSTY